MKKQIFLFFFFFFVCRFTFYVDRQPTTKEDRQTFFLLLSFFRVHMKGRPEEEVKKTNAKMLFARSRRVLFSKFVRAQSVRISFRPVLSVVFALKDRRLSFRRRMWWEKKKYTRARREKIRIHAIVPRSAMISSSSSESTSIEAVIYDDESNTRSRRPIRLSLFSSAESFLLRPFSLLECLGYQNSFVVLSFVNSKHTQTHR